MVHATGTLRTICCGLALAAAVLPAFAMDASRDDLRRFAEDMRRKHAFDGAWLDGVLKDAQSQPRILELMGRPAEQVMPWHVYRSHFMTADRIAAGVEFWIEHRGRLAEAESATGVPAHVIVGILGAETFFGRITGRFRVVDALATLAFDYPPRSAYFRGELEQFLLLAREEKVDLGTVLGSYAGAMGSAQFMPSSYRAYAVDGDGDQRRDLWGSWDDVIASVANYLAEHGWHAGEPVSEPAALWFPRADGLVPGKLAPDSTVKALRDLGLRFDTMQDGAAPALAIRVDGGTAPEWYAGFHNFGVITRYNRSVLYALVVQALGRRIESLVPSLP